MSLAYFARSVVSGERASAKIARDGFTINGHRLWSESECDLLRTLYPNFAAIRAHLPDRTDRALQHKCIELGLTKRRHRWLAFEITKLRKMYATAPRATLMAEFPDVSWEAIKKAARRHGLRRDRRKHKRTDRPLMNDILTRIEEIGWSLKDLDLESRTKKYFRSHRWRHYGLNFNAVARAIKALDGELKLGWNSLAI